MVIEAEQKIKLIRTGKLLIPFPLTRDLRNSNYSLVAVQEKLKEVTKKHTHRNFMKQWLSVIGQETFTPPYHNGKTSQFVRWMTAVSVLYLPSAKSARAMLTMQ